MRREWVKTTDDQIAPWVAALILAAWFIHLVYLLWTPVVWAWLPLYLGIQTFLSTGLFITAHDAMHGLVFPHQPVWNRRVGMIAAFLYGGFRYDRLKAAHTLHHDHPVTDQDPDFTSDHRERFFVWLLQFARRYYGWREFLRMHLHVAFILILSGGSLLKLFAYFAMPAWLSALQLFYFGTYLPHRTRGGGPHRLDCPARSNQMPVWLSLLTCYHFGYHLEHHLYPSAPWWVLPKIKRLNSYNA